MKLEQDPDIKIHESVWSWPDADPGPRVIAFVLDCLILAAINGLLEAASSRVLGSGTPNSIQTLVSILYFTLLHAKTGQTLGKKVVGIRVVPLEPSENEFDVPKVPFVRLLLRETIGRFICVVLLLYGYLRIFFRKDRMGLHDAIARTRVISLGEGRSFAISFKFVIAGFVALCMLLGGVGYYVMYFTSYPIKEFARRMEVMGFRVEGIQGSLAKGFSIGLIAKDDENLSFSVNDVAFHFENVEKEGQKGFVIRDLSVQSAKLVIRKIGKSTDKAQDSSGTSLAGPLALTAATKKSSVSDVISVLSMDLNNIEIEVPSRPTFRLKRLFASDLHIKPAVKSVNLGRLWVDSDALMVDLKNAFLQGEKISIPEPAYVLLKPQLFPEYLKAPVDIQVEGFFEGKTPTKVKLQAFNKHLSIDLQGDSGEILISKFTPFHYFKTELPLWNVDFKISGDTKMRKVDLMSGSLGLRNARFAFEVAGFAHKKDGKQFIIAPRSMANWKELLDGKDAGAFLISSDGRPARESISDIYFSKPYGKLEAQERDLVDRDVRFFADPPGLNPLLFQLSQPTAPDVNRVPSSSSGSAKLGPAGLPTKLPPLKRRRGN